MPGGKGNCAVINCHNSTYRLNKLGNEICLNMVLPTTNAHVGDLSGCFSSLASYGIETRVKMENTDHTKWELHFFFKENQLRVTKIHH